LSLQLRLRGLREQAPRGIVLAACIVTVIPYVNLVVAFPILWTIAVCMLQATVNRVARLSPSEWDASVGPTPCLPGPGVQAPPYTASPGSLPPAAPGYPASAAYPMSPVYPPIAMLPTPEQIARQARARTLVNWSHVLGWGGLGVLLVGTSFMGVMFGGAPAVVIGVLAGISMVVGAILGQIGRGMQGRVI
ncbi:MAG TPA: hypothetical protein VFT22_16595, partial [Kofleriaceae bacterium]|nr:hypothetical protein [Kofleriaceae bacterium]